MLVNCKVCEKQFKRSPSEIGENNFCSTQCAQKYFKQNPQRKKHNLYKNQKIGKLTLITIHRQTKQRKWWLCQCEYGNQISRREDYICRMEHRHYTPSCGCSYPISLGHKHPHWKGCGKLSSTHFIGIQGKAKRKNIPFTITIQEVWDLFLKQNQKCAISGVDLQFAESKKTGEIMTASLDRIDSSKGYILDNVQWVHKDVNKMKNTTSQSEFINWCKIIANYN